MTAHSDTTNLQLAKHYANQAFSLYSIEQQTSGWGDLEKGLAFLKAYGLSEHAYESEWQQIQRRLFRHINKNGYDVRFRPDFVRYPMTGGVLFEEEEYRLIQKFMQAIGDETLIILQNQLPEDDPNVLFRLKLPIELSWSELFKQGDYLMSVLFEMPHNEYFAFSESGRWGKYTANDYAKPMDIYGVQSSIFTRFIDCFWPRLSDSPLPAIADR